MSRWKTPYDGEPVIGSKVEYLIDAKESYITLWAEIEGEGMLIDGRPFKDVLLWRYIDKEYAKNIGLEDEYVDVGGGPVLAKYS